jgi:hypothetical protein
MYDIGFTDADATRGWHPIRNLLGPGLYGSLARFGEGDRQNGCARSGSTGGGFPMTLSEAQTKKINDLGIGKNVTSKISVDDQIAALRKQIAALSEAAEVPLDKDFQALEDLVAIEKEKKEKKVETVKPKKASAKKSK